MFFTAIIKTFNDLTSSVNLLSSKNSVDVENTIQPLQTFTTTEIQDVDLLS